MVNTILGDLNGSGLGFSASLMVMAPLEELRVVVFRGECRSFQSLMISWLQKASTLGRWGEGGIRDFLEGDCSLPFDGFGGGVAGRSAYVVFFGDLDLGGELCVD